MREDVQACVDALSHTKRKIHVVATDLTPRNKRLLRAGTLDYVVEQDFSAQAHDALLLLHELLAHGRHPRHSITYIRTDVITPEML